MTLAGLFLLLFAGHLLVVGSALPLAGRGVPFNHRRGVRTPATRADEAVWHEANAIVGRTLLVATGISGLATALLFSLFSAGAAIVFGLGFFVVAEGVGVVLALSTLRRKGMIGRRETPEA